MKTRISILLSCAAITGLLCAMASPGVSGAMQDTNQQASPAAGATQDTSPQAAPAQQAETAQPGAPKKPEWKSRAEYDDFQALAKETDPHKKIAAVESVLKKYPNSDFKDAAYVLEVGSYQQLGDSPKAIDAAKKALAANPDNLDASTYLSFAFPFVYDPKGSDTDTQLTQAESNAKHGLDVVGKLPKPAQVSDTQFAEYVKAKRAVFNGTLGFVVLQRKDYATAVTDLNAAKQDNPSDPYVFYRLGLAYLNAAPPDFDHAIWNLARASALAKTAKAADADAIAKYYSQVYVNRHGSDAGQSDVETQATASVDPPADFKVALAAKHAATGNQFIDAFYNYGDNLKAGGDTETSTWSQIKGQAFGGPGFVDSVEKGTDPGSFLVRIDITNDAKAKNGVYDIELKDSQPGSKDLSSGDPIRFQGTISAYTTTPSFVLTLDDGKINDEDLQAAADKKKGAAKPRPTRHHPSHSPRGR